MPKNFEVNNSLECMDKNYATASGRVKEFQHLQAMWHHHIRLVFRGKLLYIRVNNSVQSPWRRPTCPYLFDPKSRFSSCLSFW
jgi:hypothetical protein